MPFEKACSSDIENMLSMPQALLHSDEDKQILVRLRFLGLNWNVSNVRLGGAVSMQEIMKTESSQL